MQETWMSAINSRIADFVAEQSRLLIEVSPLLEPFEKFSRDFLSGGKRFRGLCCYIGNTAFTETETAGITDIASALEIFHAAALVHDDIMDNSDTRRGAPAAHKRFELLHTESLWQGNSEHFGTSSALLLGDLLLAWSDQLFSVGTSKIQEPHHALAARNEFDLMRIEVTAGQYLDIVEENAWPTVDKLDSLPRAQRVVLYKSAKYSIEAPLVTGAAAAGATESDCAQLRNIGIPLGIAFQLRDDVLGVFGDPALTGKPAGDDLREGKRTVLISLAQQQLPTTAIKLMDELLGDPDLDADQIGTLQATLVNTGALEQVEQMIDQHVDEAISHINSSTVTETAKVSLLALAQRVSQRTS